MTAGSGRGLGEAAGDPEERGLRDPVVDHLGRRDDGRVARDVLHAAPAARHHAGQVGAGEADAREHVDLEVAAPLVVGDGEGVGRAEDPEVVDEHVDLGERRDRARRALLGRDVGGERLDLGARMRGEQPVARGGRALLVAAVDDHAGARVEQPLRDRVADALRGARDEGGGSGEVDAHVVPS
jgi:hypothetical protein